MVYYKPLEISIMHNYESNIWP